jgi:hypothetical protein
LRCLVLDPGGVTGKKGNRDPRRRVQSPFPHDEVGCQVPGRPARAEGGRVGPDCAQGLDKGASFTLGGGHGHTISATGPPLLDSRGDITGDTSEHRATEQARRRPKDFTGKAIRLKQRTLAITRLPAAFGLLTRVSQESNTPVALIAQRVIAGDHPQERRS